MGLQCRLGSISIIAACSLINGCSNSTIATIPIEQPNLTLATFQKMAITQFDLEPEETRKQIIEKLNLPKSSGGALTCAAARGERCDSQNLPNQTSVGKISSPAKNDIAKVVPLLKKQSYSTLSDYSEKEIQLALGDLGKNEILKLGKISIKAPCKYDSLFISFGAKLEEFFPEKSALDLSLRHYEKAHSCTKSNRSHRAAYRAGMIRNWQGEYPRALELFRPLLAKNVDSGIRIRALYWTHRLKGVASTPEGNQLLSDYPFSLHALLIRGSGEIDIPEDAPIETRSHQGKEFNEHLIVAEGFLSLDEKKRARLTLENAFSLAQKEQPALQLYYAYLLGRVESHTLKFRILTPLLKSTDYHSKASLRLLFPEKTELAIEQVDQGPDLHLLLSLIRQESSFDPVAVSRAGAIGLMQIMPKTASMLGLENRQSLFEPVENIRLGTKYLQSLINQYGETEYALAAYNAGPHRIESWLRRYKTNDKILFVDLIPFRETREYIALIARNYFFYSNVYASSRSPASLKLRKFEIFHQAFHQGTEKINTEIPSWLVQSQEAGKFED